MNTGAAPLVLACSPRSGGNSDTAAALFAAALAEAGAAQPQSLFLRDYQVLPCVACDACAVHASHLASHLASQIDPQTGQNRSETRSLLSSLPLLGCPLSERDKSAPLLRALALAPLVCISAPIYFYHLPAMLKGLLDRLQAFWALRENGIRLFGRPRPCVVMLMGARPQGQKLFEGSLLSLRYALAQTGLEVGQTLLLYGLDGPGELAASNKARDETRACARQAALTLAKGARS